MPGYTASMLHKFHHEQQDNPQHSPHQHVIPNYSAKVQLTMTPDMSDPLDKLGIKRIQAIIEMLLYYARQVEPSMLVAIGTIAAAQSKVTEATAKVVEHLLDYCASHPNVVIRYTPSNMLLKREHDNQMNGPLLVVSTILRNVMALVTEAELGALFENSKEAAALQVTPEELGHQQPATPIQVDNSTTYGIVNSSIRQRKSKAIDMQFIGYKIAYNKANSESTGNQSLQVLQGCVTLGKRNPESQTGNPGQNKEPNNIT
eukprot:14499587-Ditylum_brightwellii.AAC.1